MVSAYRLDYLILNKYLLATAKRVSVYIASNEGCHENAPANFVFLHADDSYVATYKYTFSFVLYYIHA